MEEIKICPLALERKDVDFIYTQVKRDEKKAIYKQVSRSSGYVVAYEVIKIRIAPVPDMVRDSSKYKGFDKYEIYPSASEFGIYAWSIGGKGMEQRAEELFSSL